MKNISFAVLLLCLPALVSCAGFAPVYGQNNSFRTALTDIRLESIPGRNGFTLAQELSDRASIETGQGGEYQLKVNLRSNRSGLAVRIDNVATRYEIEMVAAWHLLDAKGKKLTSMVARSTSSFDSPDNPYASQVAEQDAEDRTIAMVSDMMLDQLAFYFAAHPAPVK